MRILGLLFAIVWLGLSIAEKDYYEIMGVPRNFDMATLKKQYKKLAKKFHPDNNPGRENHANKMFIKIQQAYDTLRDPKKKQAYDLGGEDAVNKNEQFQNAGGQGGFGEGGFGGFEDIIKTMFGGGGQGFQFNFGAGNQGHPGGNGQWH